VISTLPDRSNLPPKEPSSSETKSKTLSEVQYAFECIERHRFDGNPPKGTIDVWDELEVQSINHSPLPLGWKPEDGCCLGPDAPSGVIPVCDEREEPDDLVGKMPCHLPLTVLRVDYPRGCIQVIDERPEPQTNPCAEVPMATHLVFCSKCNMRVPFHREIRTLPTEKDGRHGSFVCDRCGDRQPIEHILQFFQLEAGVIPVRDEKEEPDNSSEAWRV